MSRTNWNKVRGLAAALSLAAVVAASPAGAQTPAEVSVTSPGVTIGATNPTVTIPVSLSRTGTDPVLGFSVRIQLSSEFSALTIGGGDPDIVIGSFLTNGGRNTNMQIVSNGGGAYTIDGVTLGADCGPQETSGTLFTIRLRSTAASGAGTVTVQTTAMRDCNNQPISVTPAGSPASVDIDNTAPTVTVNAPNGGEVWSYQSTHDILWTATDPDIANVDLEYFNGSSWVSIATAEPNDGTYAWAVPNAPTTSARVRVTAHDVNGNAGSDASDAVFTIVSNTAPALGAIGSRTVNEGSALTFTATATDGEAPPQTLTFSLDSGAPSGAVIDPGTGAFSWTPTEAQGPGNYSITVRVTDDGTPNLDDFETIAVRVNEVNTAPSLAAIPTQTVDEHVLLSLTASATDADVPANTLTYSLTAAPSGATIDPVTGAFSWTPGETDGGTSPTVTVRATDDRTTLDDQPFDGTSLPAGWAQYLWNSPSGSVTVGGGTVTIDGARVNPEPSPAYNPGATVEFVATFRARPFQHVGFAAGNHLPPNEVFSTFPSAVFSTGLPGTALMARSGDGTTQNDFTIPGSWLDVPHRYRIDWKPTSVEFRIDGTLVATQSISLAGPMRQAASDFDADGTGLTVDWIRVSDGTSPALFDEQSFVINVNEVNVAPVLTGVPSGTVNTPELALYTFDANASDVDLPAPTLTFSLQGTVPAGASIDGSTGVFTWTPTEAQGPGSVPFTVRVSDGVANTEASFTLAVDEVNVAPVLTGVPTGTVNTPELVLYTFDADATDDDVPVQTLTFSLQGTVPPGASIDGSTGVFTWTPTEAQGPGSYPFTVRVSDGVANTEASFTLDVSDANSPPALTGVPTGTVNTPELVLYTFDADATDSDDPVQTLTFSLQGTVPSGASIDGSTGVFTWTPTEAQGPGSVPFTVRVSDGVANTEASFTLQVDEVNVAPALTGVPTGTVNTPELVLYTFDANATDGDDPVQTLTFSLQGAVPPGASIDGSTGVFTWTPTELQGPGDYPLTVRVTDGVANTEASFTLHVDEVSIAAIADLSASTVRSGNDGDGTTRVLLNWTATPGGTTVKVYRARYGFYPEYDDAGGSPPNTPGYPPTSEWQLTAVTAPGQTDEVNNGPANNVLTRVAGKDEWTYAAFVLGSGENVSGVSNMPAALNYLLGDFSDGSPDGLGRGDNVVGGGDISALGTAYGYTGAAMTAYNYLDIGPTVGATVNGRPLTDNAINFEDLVIFALNFGTGPQPQAATASNEGATAASKAAAADRVTIQVPQEVSAGQEVAVRLHLEGTGAVQALSAKLAWQAGVVEPVGIEAGDWLSQLGGLALSPAPGAADVALLGVGGARFSGDGDVAVVRFRALTAGAPQISLAMLRARDASNHDVDLASSVLHSEPPRPTVTMLSPAFPNPFQSSATIGFSLAQAGPVTVTVFGVDGRAVRTLASGRHEAGVYRVEWNGSDDQGHPMSAGIYFVQLTSSQGRMTKRISYLR